MRVNVDSPGRHGQTGVGGEAGLRLYAPGHEEQVALGAGLTSEADPAGLERFHLHTQTERYAVLLQPCPENLARGVAQPGGLGTAFHAHQRDGQAPAGQ